MVRTRFGTPTIGRESMVGLEGTAVSAVDPDGTVVGDPFNDIRGFVFHAADDDVAAVAVRQGPLGMGGKGCGQLLFVH